MFSGIGVLFRKSAKLKMSEISTTGAINIMRIDSDCSNRRNWLRVSTYSLVRIETRDFGSAHCIARNVSQGGIFLQLEHPLPLGTPIRVWFDHPAGTACIAAVGEVKNHYFLQLGGGDTTRQIIGMGVRFTAFEDYGPETVALTRHCGDATLH